MSAKRLYWRTQRKVWHQTGYQDIELLRSALMGLLATKESHLLPLVRKYNRIQSSYQLKIAVLKEDETEISYLNYIKGE